MKKKGWFISALMLVVVMVFSVSALASEKANADGVTNLSEKGVTASDGVTYEEDGQIIFKSDSLDEAYFTYSAEEISALRGKTDNSVNPMADELSKSKTVTKSYANYDSIPEFLNYSEFTGGYWWNGTLPLIKAQKVSNGWNATFSGKLYTYTN